MKRINRLLFLQTATLALLSGISLVVVETLKNKEMEQHYQLYVPILFYVYRLCYVILCITFVFNMRFIIWGWIGKLWKRLKLFKTNGIWSRKTESQNSRIVTPITCKSIYSNSFNCGWLSSVWCRIYCYGIVYSLQCFMTVLSAVPRSFATNKYLPSLFIKTFSSVFLSLSNTR